MLKQILKDMYVDPDILAELPEEQKQILFFKIREEQKRRYFEFEKDMEKKAQKSKKRGFASPALKKKSKSPKKVQILEDSNGQPWTWVMGEHPNDVPIDEIWSNIGNADWEPTKNDQPVSKVQAIIFAQNKKMHGTSKAMPTPAVHGAKSLASDSQSSKNQDKISSKNLSSHKIDSLTTITEKSPNASPKTRKITDSKGQEMKEKPSKVSRVDDKPDSHKDSKCDPYENMAELRGMLPNTTSELADDEWKAQLQKFKEADRKRSFHARRASLCVKRLSQQNLNQERKLSDLHERFERKRSVRDLNKKTAAPNLPPKPKNLRSKHPITEPGRDAMPASKSDAEKWFKDTQVEEILASLDENDQIPDWFHGIITRKEAELLLENRKVGDFLVRVSEKIWGYALSYKDRSKIKHFLIDASEANCYHFFGNDCIRHAGLEHLIAFHKDEPISYGNETLCDGVGQKDPAAPDYAELITFQPTSNSEVTVL